VGVGASPGGLSGLISSRYHHRLLPHILALELCMSVRMVSGGFWSDTVGSEYAGEMLTGTRGGIVSLQAVGNGAKFHSQSSPLEDNFRFENLLPPFCSHV